MFFLLNVHKSFGMAGYTAIDNWNQHQEGNILVYWRNWGTPYFKSWNLNWFLPLCRAYTLHPVHDSVWYLPQTLLGVSSLPSMRQFASLLFFFFFFIRRLHFPDFFYLHSSYCDWVQLYGCLPIILTDIQLLHMSCAFWPPCNTCQSVLFCVCQLSGYCSHNIRLCL